MKKNLLKNISILMLCATIFNSCEKLTDIQQEFLDRGEQIYVGKVDSIDVCGGYYRANITGSMHYANTASACVIRWMASEVSDSIVIPSSHWENTGKLNVVLDNLKEDLSYRFFVQTYDKNDNKSLNSEVNGSVYGEDFVQVITPKVVTRIRKVKENVILSWTSPTDRVSFVEMKYETNNGMETRILPAAIENDTISNWKSLGNVEYRTASIPEENAIDTLYTTWSATQFPK